MWIFESAQSVKGAQYDLCSACLNIINHALPPRDYPFLAVRLCGHVRKNVSHFCIGIVIFLMFSVRVGGQQ